MLLYATVTEMSGSVRRQAGPTLAEKRALFPDDDLSARTLVVAAPATVTLAFVLSGNPRMPLVIEYLTLAANDTELTWTLTADTRGQAPDVSAMPMSVAHGTEQLPADALLFLVEMLQDALLHHSQRLLVTAEDHAQRHEYAAARPYIDQAHLIINRLDVSHRGADLHEHIARFADRMP